MLGNFSGSNLFSRRRAETRLRKSQFRSTEVEVWGRVRSWGQGPGASFTQLPSPPPSPCPVSVLAAADGERSQRAGGHAAAWRSWRPVRRSQLVQNSCARQRLLHVRCLPLSSAWPTLLCWDTQTAARCSCVCQLSSSSSPMLHWSRIKITASKNRMRASEAASQNMSHYYDRFFLSFLWFLETILRWRAAVASPPPSILQPPSALLPPPYLVPDALSHRFPLRFHLGIFGLSLLFLLPQRLLSLLLFFCRIGVLLLLLPAQHFAHIGRAAWWGKEGLAGLRVDKQEWVIHRLVSTCNIIKAKLDKQQRKGNPWLNSPHSYSRPLLTWVLLTCSSFGHFSFLLPCSCHPVVFVHMTNDNTTLNLLS